MSTPESSPAVRPGARTGARTGLRHAALLFGAVLAGFVAAGAVGGLVWHWLWTPPQGVALDGAWVPLSVETLDNVFAGTALYVAVGVVIGVVLGILAGLRRGHELVVLAAVVVGSLVAGLVMARIGVALSPPEPGPIAATADDGTPIPDTMTLDTGRVLVAWPFGALLGLASTYLLLPGRRNAGEATDTELPDAPGGVSSPLTREGGGASG